MLRIKKINRRRYSFQGIILHLISRSKQEFSEIMGLYSMEELMGYILSPVVLVIIK